MTQKRLSNIDFHQLIFQWLHLYHRAFFQVSCNPILNISAHLLGVNQIWFPLDALNWNLWPPKNFTWAATLIPRPVINFEASPCLLAITYFTQSDFFLMISYYLFNQNSFFHDQFFPSKYHFLWLICLFKLNGRVIIYC